jgi:hypothetical protein
MVIRMVLCPRTKPLATFEAFNHLKIQSLDQIRRDRESALRARLIE